MFRKKEISKDEIMLEVEGGLTGNKANDFQEHLEELANSIHSTISLNLSEVNTINSSCIGKILLFRKKLSDEGRNITIKGCSDSLYHTFQLIKFDKLIDIEK